MRAQTDVAGGDDIEAAGQKITEEKAKTEAEIRALEAEKARHQQ